MKCSFSNAVLVAFLLASCGIDKPVQSSVLAAPENETGSAFGALDDFPTKSPAEAGVDLAVLEKIVAGARESDSTALVVVKDGHLLGEWYFGEEQGLIEAMSATKSIVSLAIGLLIDDGKIASLDTPVHIFFPEWSDGPKRKITVRHLLAHSSGLECKPTTEDIYQSDDFVRFGLDAKVEKEPLEQIFYNNRAFNILTGVVEKASGRRMDEFLKARLFDPIGISGTSWTLDKAGNPHAMSGLQIRPLDLAKIGQLMIDRGVWRGKRIVSEEWVTQSTAPAAQKFPRLGLGWWLIIDIKMTIDESVIATWREAGVDEAFIQKVMPLKDRLFSHDEFFEEAEKIFGGKEGLETWYDNTWRRGLPDGKIVEKKVIGYYADGYLGQYLIVVPGKRIVVVRMRREPSATGNNEDEEKNGFQDILKLTRRL
ncbi:MAG: serine hydrolase [Bacilli bacterium]|jgi:CubicO group peptidase (beta-lactamase class C family)